MAPTSHLKPHRRKGHWYLVRRVPNEYRSFEKRSIIFQSTKIAIHEDPKGVHARIAIAKLNRALESQWASLASPPSQRDLHQQSLRIAADHGIPYVDAERISTLPPEDFYARVDIAKQEPNEAVVAAVLGGTHMPPIMVSEILKEYESIIALALKRKTPRQLKKWRIARQSALDYFKETIGGDMAITDLTRVHTVKYRNALRDRVLNEGIAEDTCNRNITRISGMFNAINETHQLNLNNIFRKLKFPNVENNPRIPFTTKAIQDCLLKPGNLNGMNEDARHIVYAMIETGLRLSEVCNLREDNIVLNHDVPHLRITDKHAELKSKSSRRELPLVGISLEAIKRHPKGFDRYFDKADVASATINKFLHENKIVPKKQTLYCLRHSFDDRLRLVHAPDKINAELMGHKWHRPKYGAPTLQEKQEWLDKMAFKTSLEQAEEDAHG